VIIVLGRVAAIDGVLVVSGQRDDDMALAQRAVVVIPILAV
jgi:hypothetical protein